MITSPRIFRLIICMIALSIIVGPALAAQYIPSAPTSSYLPFAFRDYSFVLPQLAFIGVDPNNYANQYIYRASEDGSGLINLTSDPTSYLNFAWSPDGSKIVFSSYWGNNDEIYVMNADGSGRTQLTYELGTDRSPTWSPDGRKIAFISDRQGSIQVYVMNPDGSTVTRLTNITPGCTRPVWSPDGSKIAFDVWGIGYNDEEIYVANADGSGSVRLTNNSYFDAVDGWSPDSSKILFRSNRDSVNSEDVYEMNTDGSDPVRLTTSGFIQKAAWSPDGSKIAYSTTDGLFIMDPDGTNKIEVLCQSNHIATFNQSWSPDGLKIAYSLSSAVIGDTTGIYAVRIDGSSCSHLTTMLASAPQWRP